MTSMGWQIALALIATAVVFTPGVFSSTPYSLIAQYLFPCACTTAIVFISYWVSWSSTNIEWRKMFGTLVVPCLLNSLWRLLASCLPKPNPMGYTITAWKTGLAMALGLLVTAAVFLPDIFSSTPASHDHPIVACHSLTRMLSKVTRTAIIRFIYYWGSRKPTNRELDKKFAIVAAVGSASTGLATVALACAFPWRSASTFNRVYLALHIMCFSFWFCLLVFTPKFVEQSYEPSSKQNTEVGLDTCPIGAKSEVSDEGLQLLKNED